MREGRDAGEPRGVLVVLSDAALTLGDIAGEKNDDGVEVGAGQAAHPVVGVVGAGVAEDLRPGRHALTKLFGKGCQRSLVYAQSPQTTPGEGHAQPSRI